MGEYCLTIYDVTGIQEFIFASNKAKENIGGSIYVQNIFEKELIRCIKSLGKKVKIDWKKSISLDIKTDNLMAEVVYIGGGNAMVLFDQKSTAIDVTKMLSKIILEDTQAVLGIAVAYHKTNMDNFRTDKEYLLKQLNINKNRLVQSTPLRGISITRECEDGLPTSGKKSEDNIYISNIAAKKRELTKNETDKSSIFPDVLLELSQSLDNKSQKFPVEFDDLGQTEGESHIAVVHIDGNSIGQFIDDKLNKTSNYDKTVSVIREISFGLQKLYAGIFKKMTAFCSKTIEKEAVQKKIKLKDNNLPIRPIILNGDDVTFVCEGRIGIQLAEFFLKELTKTPLQLESGDEEISACAGIAIVKSHFPFFRAYELAEELCTSAKKKAKYLNRKMNNPGCWLDYHMVYSGFQADLHGMRKKSYNVPGMSEVSRDVENKFPQYNLLLRPFCVSGDSDDMYKWDNMKELYSKMVNISRSRLKDLRNSFIISKEAVILQQNQNNSRNCTLPPYKMRKGIADCTCNNLFAENQTPFFEPLELLDFYIPEFEKKNKGEQS